jgi:hypothetical protein
LPDNFKLSNNQVPDTEDTPIILDLDEEEIPAAGTGM